MDEFHVLMIVIIRLFILLFFLFCLAVGSWLTGVVITIACVAVLVIIWVLYQRKRFPYQSAQHEILTFVRMYILRFSCLEVDIGKYIQV